MNQLPDFPEKLWIVRDVAEFGHTSQSWVYKAAERGELPHIRVGSMLRFDPAAVKRFFASRCVPASP